MKVQRPKPEGTVELKTIVRQTAELRIPLSNPLKESIVFEVTKDGDSLYGDDSIQIGPLEQKEYVLKYSPGKISCLEV